ncbi:MAG: hypothetical protein ACFFDN_22175 [Candidatus Hodarchaeota archaeon]
MGNFKNKYKSVFSIIILSLILLLSGCDDKHTLSKPEVVYPNGGETFECEIINVSWKLSVDSKAHDVVYSVSYIQGGGSPTLIAPSLTQSYYIWDISTAGGLSGSDFQIQVEAECSEGLTNSDVSDEYFTINCNDSGHSLSPPEVIYPNGGETFNCNDNVTIQWSAASDSLGHSITYSVFLSSDATSWQLLDSGLTGTSTLWVITTSYWGDTYLIKVEAECSTGLTADDISDDTFSIYCNNSSMI